MFWICPEVCDILKVRKRFQNIVINCSCLYTCRGKEVKKMNRYVKRLACSVVIILFSFTACFQDTGSSGTYGDTLGAGSINTPQNLIATQGDFGDRIELQWDSVDNAACYYVYRASLIDTHYWFIGSLDAPAVSTYNSTTEPEWATIIVNIHYLYKVSAVDAYGNESILSDFAEGWATTP